MTHEEKQAPVQASIRTLIVKLIISFCITVASTVAIVSLFVPQWSRLVFDVSLKALETPDVITSQTPKTEIVISEGLVAPSEQIATISASFFNDLIRAILEASSEAEVASVEAQLEQYL